MKKTNKTVLALLALGASVCLAVAQDNSSGQQPPEAGAPPHRGQGGPGGLHLLPPRAQEQLNLTDEQKTQIAALEAETKAKVEKILTPEQLQQLKQMRPPQRQGQGQGQGVQPGQGSPEGLGGQGGQDRPPQTPPGGN